MVRETTKENTDEVSYMGKRDVGELKDDMEIDRTTKRRREDVMEEEDYNESLGVGSVSQTRIAK